MLVHVSLGNKTSKFSYITKHIDLHLANMENNKYYWFHYVTKYLDFICSSS